MNYGDFKKHPHTSVAESKHFWVVLITIQRGHWMTVWKPLNYFAKNMNSCLQMYSTHLFVFCWLSFHAPWHVWLAPSDARTPQGSECRSAKTSRGPLVWWWTGCCLFPSLVCDATDQVCSDEKNYAGFLCPSVYSTSWQRRWQTSLILCGIPPRCPEVVLWNIFHLGICPAKQQAWFIITTKKLVLNLRVLMYTGK